MIFDNLLTTTGLAAVGTAVIAGWRNIKEFSRYVMGILLFQKKTDQQIARALTLHLRKSYKRPPSGVSEYSSIREVVDDKQYRSTIPFDLPTVTTLWWGPRGVFLFNAQQHTLTSLRRFSDPQGLICDALDAEDARRESLMTMDSGNFYVHPVIGSVGAVMDFGNDKPARKRGNNAILRDDGAVPTASGETDSANSVDRHVDESFRYPKERYMRNRSNSDPLRGLFYPEEVKRLIADLKRWYLEQRWYQDRGLPWRTGVLLHGPGGTGKSSLSRATAQMLGIPLYQYYLNTLTDKDFVEEWGRMDTPCVVALEDFDTAFHGRESVTHHKSLSFECVLNQISGISAVNGVLLMVTTNNVDHIDAAMGQVDEHGRPTRPGRIDRIVYMGTTEPEQRREIARYTLNGIIDDEVAIQDLVDQGNGTTAAQFADICVQKALEKRAEAKGASNVITGTQPTPERHSKITDGDDQVPGDTAKDSRNPLLGKPGIGAANELWRSVRREPAEV